MHATTGKRGRDPRGASDSVLLPKDSHGDGPKSSKEAVEALQAQVEQLKLQKDLLRSRSVAELQLRDETNKALDKQVRELQDHIKNLDAEADELMNSESKDMEAATVLQDTLYKNLLKSETEACILRTRVAKLEKQLEVINERGSKDWSSDKSEGTRNIFHSTGVQTGRESLNDMGTQVDMGSLLSAPCVKEAKKIASPIKTKNAETTQHVGTSKPGGHDPKLLLYPDDAPSQPAAEHWFRKAFLYLNVDLGAEYQNLIIKWIDLERSTTWDSAHRGLGTKGRPGALSAWQRKRYVSPEPDVSDANFVVSFSEEVWKWWRSLQPKWRLIKSGEKLNLPDLKVAGLSWTTLDKKGINGWFGIMVCLKWWGMGLNFCAAEEKVKLTEDWIEAIGDISAMLDGLLAHRASQV